MKTDNVKIERSSGNVFADLGLPDAEGQLLKAELVTRIDEIIRRRGLKQVEAARVLSLSQPDVSRLPAGELSGVFGGASPTLADGAGARRRDRYPRSRYAATRQGQGRSIGHEGGHRSVTALVGGRGSRRRSWCPPALTCGWAEVIDYRCAGVLSGDRESAALVTLPLLFGKRGGSICSVADNLVTGETFSAGAGHDTARRIALRGLAILSRMDREKAEAGQMHWTPSLRG